MSLVAVVVKSADDRDECSVRALDGHQYSLLCIDGVRAPKIRSLYMILTYYDPPGNISSFPAKICIE
jgi:hypothetical protein